MVETLEKKTSGEISGGDFGEIPGKISAAFSAAIPAGNLKYDFSA